VSLIIFFAILAGVALYFMKPEERAPIFRAGRVLLERARDELIRRVRRLPNADGTPPQPIAVVTSIVVIVHAWIFMRMLLADGSLSDPEVLLSWGGNVGPRTTNGEWWRLVTSTFIHSGMLHFAATIAGLVAIGGRVERLAGRLPFIAVYLIAGTLGSFVHLNASPLAVGTGASAAVFGIYGLLAASWTWGLLRGSIVPIPLDVAKRVAPAVALFVLYSAFTSRLQGAGDIAGLAAGLISGFVLARTTAQGGLVLKPIAALSAATAVIIVALAVPVRGLTDVRPEIARVVALEQRTAKDYEGAVVRFRNNRISAAALAEHIERSIVPELRASAARLQALERVPREHEPRVTAARDYLRLREESWKLRAAGLRNSRMKALQQADRTERQALDALQQAEGS
jgi:rhomboid protease GluP